MVYCATKAENDGGLTLAVGVAILLTNIPAYRENGRFSDRKRWNWGKYVTHKNS